VPKFTPETIEEFLLDLMLCVRTSVLNGTKIADGLTAGALPATAFTDVHSYELNRGGTDHKVFLVDYASAVFHFVREACGVSESAFLLAWSANDIRAAQVEGSDLVYSCDKRFVAMPLLDRDLAILMEILPSYCEYVRANPHTLLLKMFGLVSLAKGKKMCLYLLVENVFHHHIPLHYMFHLAASASVDPQKSGVLSRVSNTLRRRSASQSKITLQRSRSAFGTLVQGRQRSSSLLLDPPPFAKDKLGQVRSTVFGNEVSWKAEGRTILVEKSLRPLLLQQLEKDLMFLRDCAITDHKIVVGIHEGEPIAPPSPDLESKRLIKVPSLVVFQSTGSPLVVKTPSKKGGSSAPPTPETPPTTPIAGSAFDLSNLRRGKRVSVQSVDLEQPQVSPFRAVKGGLHSRNAQREELYYVGIIDIFAVSQKDSRRQEKAASRFTTFRDWINENLEEFVDPNPKPVAQMLAGASPGMRASLRGRAAAKN
jgi:hypothetical protein